MVAALATSGAFGCSDHHEPAADVRSRYVDLFLDADVEVCAGQLDAYDSFIERIFDAWTGHAPDPDFRVHVHATNDAACGQVAEGFTRSNCFHHGVVSLSAYYESYHELVHAVVNHVDGFTVATISEGTAEAFGTGYPRKLDSDYLSGLSREELFSAHPNGVEYPAGGGFMKFLIDDEGVDQTREYYRRMGKYEFAGVQVTDFETEFNDVFGRSLPEAWAEFVAEPRCLYQTWYCAEIEAVELPFALQSIECDEPGAQNFDSDAPLGSSHFAPVRIVRVETSAAMTVTMRLQHVNVNLGRCGECAVQLDNTAWVNGTGDERETPIELEAGTSIFILEALSPGPARFSLEPTP